MVPSITFLLHSFVFILALAETVIYPGVTANKIGVPFWQLFLGVLLTSTIIRLFISKRITERIFKSYFIFGGTVITLIAWTARGVELAVSPNFIFTTFHVDPVAIGMLALYFFVLGIPFATQKVLKQNYRYILPAFAFLATHLILTRWSKPELFYAIRGEDQLIEYLTFLFFLIGSIIAGFTVPRVLKLSLPKQIAFLFASIYTLLAIGLFIIAGEEISWAQRIIGYDTPDNIAQTNTQNEFNLHNNYILFSYVYIAYLFVNAYGLTSWMLYRLISSRISEHWMKIGLRLITTRWYLMVFFLPNLIYTLLRFRYGNAVIDEFEELSELYLSMGILFMLVMNYFFIKEELGNKKI